MTAPLPLGSNSPRTTPWEKAAYALYPFSTQLVGMLVMSYLSIFYTDQAGLPTSVVATLFLVVKLWDAANDLIFGGLLDRVRHAGGKFLFWLNWGGLIFPLTTVFLFWTGEMDLWLKVVLAYGTYLVWEMSNTISDIPHGALALSMTENLNDRNTLISLGIFAGIAGALLTGLTGATLIESLGYSGSATLLGGIALLGMLPLRFAVKEKIPHPEKEIARLKDVFRALVQNKPLFYLNLSFLLLMSSTFVLTIGAYFVKWNLGDPQLMAVVLLSNFIPVALLPLILPLLIPRFGKRNLFIFGLASGIVLSVVQYFVGYENLPLFLVINGLKVLGIYLPVTMKILFVADCAEYNLSLTGERNEGSNFALSSFFGKIGSAVSGSLAVFLLGVFGYRGEAPFQSPEALEGIWLLTSLLPVGGMVLALILFASSYHLEEQAVKEIIAKRQKGAMEP